MILNRLGNKKKIAHRIFVHFPPHDIYLEPFFGAGGMFFKKPLSKYNILNDLDSDVYNLFRQLIDNKDDLIKLIKIVPITEEQFKSWTKGKREDTDLLNALRFLIISNFGMYGHNDTLKFGAGNTRQVILNKIHNSFEYLSHAIFMNCDFRDFTRKVSWPKNLSRCFLYADPPYVGTSDNYSHSFTLEDHSNLLDELEGLGIKYAVSEFNNPEILHEAEKRGLNVQRICERQTLKNRSVEILITNYTHNATLFDGI